jgi:hypothetical protein
MALGSLIGRKYIKVTIVKPIGKNYQEIKTLWINIKETDFKHDKHTYALDLKEVIISKRGKPSLIYEQGNTNPISLNNKSTKVNNKQLTAIMQTNILNRIFFSQREKYYSLIIGALVVSVIGVAVFSVWQMQESQNGIIELFQQLTEGGYIPQP